MAKQSRERRATSGESSNMREDLPLLDRMSKLNQLRANSNRRLKVAGLFAGIGGLELGLHRSGHETPPLCDIDPGACGVLKHHFPTIPLHEDVCTLKSLPSDTDLITAGFPCQDLSQAGKTVGIEGSRSGLVGEVFRLVSKRRVRWLLL